MSEKKKMPEGKKAIMFILGLSIAVISYTLSNDVVLSVIIFYSWINFSMLAHLTNNQ